jgi:hypothetical protein
LLIQTGPVPPTEQVGFLPCAARRVHGRPQQSEAFAHCDISLPRSNPSSVPLYKLSPQKYVAELGCAH